MKLSTLVSFTVLAAAGLTLGACSQRENTLGMHPEAHATVVAVHSDGARVADRSVSCKHGPCAGDQS
jgi:hypothetical protein